MHFKLPTTADPTAGKFSARARFKILVRSLAVAVLFSTALQTQMHAESVLIDYNFNSLTNSTALAGQDDWINFSSAGNAGPVVRSFTPTGLSAQQGAGWSTSGTGSAARAYREFDNFNLTTGFTVTIEFDLVRVGANAQALLGIGSAAAPAAVPATVGTFSTSGWVIRSIGEGTSASALDGNGNAIVPTQNNLYRVRSVWDLGAATGSLAVMNLSAGETAFTPLYFNAAQTQSTVSFGTLGDVTQWNDLLVRTGGFNQTAGGFLDNVYVTAVPEPSVVALLAGAAAVLLLARRRK